MLKSGPLLLTPVKILFMDYNFKRCKLCGRETAQPAYPLGRHSIYCCGNCDFHTLDRLDDIPALQLSEKRLTDRDRHYIELRAGESARLNPQRLLLVQQYLEPGHLKTLDIGAGLGQFQRLLAALGHQAHGIEPSRLQRQYAQEMFSLPLSDELVDDPYWQETYCCELDLITLWDVIEHVNFPRQTLAAAINLLKPGGLIFLDTPSRDVAAYRISEKISRLSRGKTSLYLGTFYSSAPYGHKQIFTPDQLTNLFRELELDIVCRQSSYFGKQRKGGKIILGGRKPA